MKNMKRALRRHQKETKHLKRLKRWASDLTLLQTKDGEWIYNPSWEDVKNNYGVSFKLKTMSTICSCPMCACDKYNRIEQKKIDKMFFKLNVEE
jgi:hypothetical protein